MVDSRETHLILFYLGFSVQIWVLEGVYIRISKKWHWQPGFDFYSLAIG